MRKRNINKLIDGMNDAVFIHNLEGNFLAVNDEAAERLGYSREELLDLRLQDIDTLEYSEKVKERIQDIEEDETLVFETVHVSEDGEEIPVEISSSLITYQGEPAVFSVARDIAERKETEEKLRESKRQLDAILNDSESFIGVIDTDGTLLEANETSLRFVDSSPAEVEGEKFWNTPWWNHSAELQEKLKESIEKVKGGGIERFEATHVGENGEKRTVDFSLRPVRNEDNEIVSLIASGKNITERKEREQELKRKNRYLDHIPEFVTVVDEKGEVKYQAHGASESTGLDVTKVIESSGFEFIHPEDREQVQEMFSEILENPGEEYRIELRGETKDGWTWFEVRAVNYLDEPEIDGIIVTAQNITDRKKAEEELEEYTQELQFINDTVLRASRMDEIGEICQFVAEKVYEYNKDTYVLVSLYDRDLDRIRFRGMAGFNEDLIESINEVLGTDFRELKVDSDEVGEEASLYISGELEKVPGGLYALSTGEVPREDCGKLEDLMGIKSVYTVGFSREGESYGGIIILTPDDKEIQYESGIETISRNISEMLQHRQAEEELRRSEKRKDSLNTLLRQDLKNKYMIIHGYHQLLEDADLSEEEKKYLEKSIKAASEADEILGLAKKLDKIEGKKRIEEKDIINILKLVIDNVSGLVEREGVEVEEKYPETISEVEGDYSLNTLFAQLLTTRIQLGECNRIRIEARERGEDVLLRIEDDGKKLPGDVKNLFTGKVYKGDTSGVGGVRYYILREIANHNNAEIEAKDSDLGGARFDTHLQKA